MNSRWRASCSLASALLVSLLAGIALAAPPSPPLADKPAKAGAAARTYALSSPPEERLALKAPELPDLSGYTASAVAAKIQRDKPGRISVRRMLQQPTLKHFIGGNNRMGEWVRRQGGMPQAIFIEDGYATLATLAQKLPRQYFRATADGVYLARLPIVVARGATLHIDRATLRLSQERGAFLVNDGRLFVTDSSIIGWREAANGAASFRRDREFRPFLLAWGGTETYVVGSRISHLGYSGEKSFGFSISQYTPSMSKRMGRKPPTGWLLDSEFSELWFGFYCFGADDVVIKDNTYRDNIVYGIDPHDHSRRLIIAGNSVHGTRGKHGIILSREVNDSWIFNNQVHDNALSGIVLDRDSSNTLVAYNDVYRNRSDGITLYESPDNLLWGNQVAGNTRHGIRLRNSVNIRLYENLVVGNGLSGVYGHIKDLADQHRNLKLDPYETKVSMVLVGGQLAGNGSVPLVIDSPLSLQLYRVDMAMPDKASGITFSGILGERQEEIFDLLVRQRKAVRIDLVDSQSDLQP
ncbi:mannuronan 5-epimerase AlgG [Pseudomonas sp. GCM10022186]|uniref:mannuronan 5-epimerase AlgG n=1 Tax=Pseudomonas sp. GCM10022186 TaxID=3252650 RepID=UPI00360A6E44